MVNQWDLLPHIPDWRSRPIYPMLQRDRNHGQKNSLCPYSYHGLMHYAVETTKPHHTWERHYPLKFMRCHIRAGKLHCTPEWKAKLSIYCCKSDLLKCIIPEMEHVLLKEGRKWETWSGIFHPQSIIWHQQHGLHRPACTTCQSGQVPKAAASFSSRPGGHILFSTGTIIWTLSLSPPLA